MSVVGAISFNALKKCTTKKKDSSSFLICPILSSQLMPPTDAFALKVKITITDDKKQQKKDKDEVSSGLVMPPKLSPAYIKNALLNMLAYGSMKSTTTITSTAPTYDDNMEENKELAFLVSKKVFLSTPSAYTFHGPQSGKTLRAEIIPALIISKTATTTTTKMIEVVGVWSTTIWTLSNPITEYWMTDPAMDLSSFLATYIHEKKMLVEGVMLSYTADCHFEPDIVRGSVYYAGRTILFTKGIKY